MAAAEKFKTAEPPAVVGEAPSNAAAISHDSEEEEVCLLCCLTFNGTSTPADGLL